MTLVGQAYHLARELHAAQVRRESGRPFFDAHLVPVAELVQTNGGDELAIAAAYLHDAISPSRRSSICSTIQRTS
jgi:(p)ppGpp synthase/HD superfamily hydrolase